MCGIAGAFPTHNSSLVEKLIEAQSHRGPDGHGIYQSKDICIGQNRLAVVTDNEHDLPYRRDGLVIAFNGEITNYKHLAKSLNCWHFETETDTEVLLAAYKKWGDKCLTRIEGMFAFVIWDEVRQQGFAARDPVGVKPFFFTRQSGSFIFSSELQALLKVTTPKGLRDSVIAEALVAPYFSGALTTPFEGVEVLPPGSFAKFSHSNFRVEEYFHYLPESKLGCQFDLGVTLMKAVDDNLDALEQPGLFLSGGLDSSLLATRGESQHHFIMDYHDHEAICYDINGIVNSSDTNPALEVSGVTGGMAHLVQAGASEVITALETAIGAQASIVVWPQEVTQQLLARFASSYCKSVLVGDAADETHFGYFFVLDPKVCQTPQSLFENFDAPPLSQAFSTFKQDLAESYIKLCESRGYSWRRAPALSASYLVSRMWLGRLLLNGDVHTMRHSLESRVPFANRPVLEAAQSLSLETSFKNSLEKSHLRSLIEGVLPNSIVKRKKSALPFYQFLRFKDMLGDLPAESQAFLAKNLDFEQLMRQPEAMSHFRAYTLGRWYHLFGRHYE